MPLEIALRDCKAISMTFVLGIFQIPRGEAISGTKVPEIQRISRGKMTK